MVVGAGTVLTREHAERAVASGARFLVAPGFDSSLVDWCRSAGVPIIPGAVTATEITTALAHGIGLVKFFPAETSGGIAAVRALSGPFPGIEFMPTGGIDPSNLEDYLRLPNVAACGGSWPAGRELMRSRDFAAVEAAAAAAVATVAAARSTT